MPPAPLYVFNIYECPRHVTFDSCHRRRTRFNGSAGLVQTPDRRKLWNEYEEQETDTARFVKDCDRVEMILQAHEYEVMNGGLNGSSRVDLSDFFETTIGLCRFEQTKAWDDEVRRLRAKFWEERKKEEEEEEKS